MARLLVMDIDHFKRINDVHGHSTGDGVLVGFEKRIESLLRGDLDWCARLGGEEFAVVLPDTEMDGAFVVAERLRCAIASEPIPTGAAPIAITVSVGISAVEGPASATDWTVEQLLHRADQCLYASKHAGRNRATADQVTTSE